MQLSKLQLILLILNLVWVPVSTVTYISGCEDAPIQCYESGNLICQVSGNVTGLNQNTLYSCAQNSMKNRIELRISSGGEGVTLNVNISFPDNIKALEIWNYSPEPVTVETATVNMNVIRIIFYVSEVYVNQNDFFSYFQSLEYLYADKIGSEGMPIFSKNINMETINVFAGNIRNETSRVITSEMIGGLSKLQYFYWRNSEVTEIRSDAFHGLTSLLSCSLSENNIHQLYDCTFSDLVNMYDLDLSYNDIRTVGKYAFIGFNTSLGVYLNNNPSFPFNTLTLAKSITNLNLDGYNSSLINAQFLQQFPHLSSVYFGSTPFDCSCEYEWISKLKTDFNIYVGFGYNTFCSNHPGIQVDNSSLYTNCSNNVTYQCFNHSIVCEGENWLRVDSGNTCLCTYPPERSLYNETSFVCSDIDECEDDSTVCEGNCSNTIGSYTCACGDGYVNANVTTCSDVNECMTANGGCSQNCTNAIGSYACSCGDGFVTNGTTCNDVNECITANGGCSQNCTNTPGSYRCSCSEGYYISLSNSNNCDLVIGGTTGPRIVSFTETEFSIFVVATISIILILWVTIVLIFLCIFFKRRSRVPKLKPELKPTLSQLEAKKAEKDVIFGNPTPVFEVVPSETKKVDQVVSKPLAPQEGTET